MLTLFIDHLRHFPPLTCSHTSSLTISHLDASLLWTLSDDGDADDYDDADDVNDNNDDNDDDEWQ